MLFLSKFPGFFRIFWMIGWLLTWPCPKTAKATPAGPRSSAAAENHGRASSLRSICRRRGCCPFGKNRFGPVWGSFTKKGLSIIMIVLPLPNHCNSKYCSTIYHHFPVAIRGSFTPLYINQPTNGNWGHLCVFFWDGNTLRRLI